jgi:hypothetical protein
MVGMGIKGEGVLPSFWMRFDGKKEGLNPLYFLIAFCPKLSQIISIFGGGR